MAHLDDRVPAKSAARSALRRNRRARAPRENAAAEFSAWADEVALLAGTGAVAAFVPTPLEPPIAGLLERLVGLGHEVLLPRPEGADLHWVVFEPVADHEIHPEFNVAMPQGHDVGVGMDALVERNCKLILMPALAVTTAGERLGQGGGFYDRLFSGGTRELPRVAVVWEDEVLAPSSIPTESHDVPVTHVLTERRFDSVPDGQVRQLSSPSGTSHEVEP